jgi:ATP-dependent Clp protease protease subunit
MYKRILQQLSEHGVRSERLRALLADPNRPRRFEAKADEATIYLYDEIVSEKWLEDFGIGVAAETFVKALNGLTAPVIHLRINSPGGDVFAGRVMEQAIRNHPSRVIAHVDGYAASAATYVAIAADEVEIVPGGFFMIHNAWTRAIGDSVALMDTAALLEKIDGTLRETYAAKTGKSADEIKAWMDAETWFTGQEAVDAGFIDRVAEAKAKAAAAAAPPADTSEHDHRARTLVRVELTA